MKNAVITSLSVVLVAGCIQARAQDVDVQAELASQRARITELETKMAAKPATGALQFPVELTPYILIDTTITDTSNATTDGRKKLDFGVAYLSGCRWGLKGTLKTNVEDLNIIYKLESEYETPTGNMDTPGVLFNRDAWVGFTSKSLGQITIGRQNTLARDFSQSYGDPFGHPEVNYDEGGWTNNNNFKQLIYFVASEDGTRENKGFVWKKVMENGFALGASYNLTSTETNTSTKNSTGAVALGYNAKTFNVAGTYTQANKNGFTEKSYSVGGNVNFTPMLRVNAGYFHYTAEQGVLNPQRSDNAYTMSASITAAPWSYYLGHEILKANDAGVPATGYMTNPFSDGSTAAAFDTGSKSTTYAAIMRSLNKRCEVYAVADYMKLKDGYKLAATHGHDDQTVIGIGVRIRAL